MSQITFIEEFASAHFYKQNQFSESENKSTFDACFTDYGHGHNYKLHVTFELEKNAEIAKTESPEEFASNYSNSPQASLIQKKIRSIVNKLEHQHINFVIDEFKLSKNLSKANVVPTTENIATWISKKLQNAGLKPAKIRLYEMDNLYVEILNP